MMFFRLTKFLMAVMFFLMVALTNVEQPLKIAVLLIVFFLVSSIYYKYGVFFDSYLLMMTILVIIVGVVGVLVGALKNTEGFVFYIPLTIIYPFLVFYFSPIYLRFSVFDIDFYIIVLTIFTSFVSLFFIFLVFFLNLDFIGDIYKSVYGGVAYVSHYDGENIKFMLPVIDFFVFSFPYLIISSILRFENYSHNRLRYFALFMSICVVFFSGRRAILIFSCLILIVSIFFILLFYPSKKTKRKVVKYSFLIFLVFLSFFTFLYVFSIVDFSYFMDVLFSSLDFSSNVSNLERVKQFDFLLSGFYDSYFFGNGFGAVAGYQRSSKGWQYELQYMAWLFQGGLVVTFIYAITLLFVFFVILKSTLSRSSMANQVYFTITMSLSVVFLSNATNPYLSKFDMMWVFSLLIYCFIHSKKDIFANEK